MRAWCADRVEGRMGARCCRLARVLCGVWCVVWCTTMSGVCWGGGGGGGVKKREGNARMGECE
jgi:hypothetical protein